MNALFIGNSYTYYNDLPALFEAMARKAGLDVTAYSVTKGGWKLHQYAFAGDEYTQQAFRAIAERPYEAVFLQDYSLAAIEAPGDMLLAVRALAERIAPLCARVILYQTWPRTAGHEKLAELGMTPAQMEAVVRQKYEEAAKSVNAQVAFAGKAMLDAAANCPAVTVYAPDGSHPAYAGSYLAACMLLYTYAGIRPLDIAYDGDLPGDVADALRASAEGTLCALWR